MKPNPSLAALAGVVAALIGAAIWAIVTVMTEHQIGFMAIGVGLLVGFAVSKFGHGSGPAFGVIGAVCALLGCLLGNFFAGVGFISSGIGESYFTVLSRFDLKMVGDLMSETFEGMDLFFYGIAIFEGFKFGSKGSAKTPIAETTAAT